jgi:hypothetical protein
MFTLLASLLALGTIGFWLLVLIDFIVITALVENEEGVWATVVAIGSIIGLNYLWKLPIVATIKANPGHTALLIASYFALGIGWSFAKWVLFLHKQNFKYRDFKTQFLSKKNAKELTPELAAALMEELDSHNRYESYPDRRISANAPQFLEHKGKLTRWATYWPFSIIGTLLNDVVRKSWTYIINMLQGTYQRISNYIFRGATADKALAENYKAKQAAAGADGGSSDAPSRRRGY